MENQRSYMKTMVQYQSQYQPRQIWERLVHPKYAVRFAKKPCYHNDIPEGFVLEKGSQWIEIHTGDDCQGDIVTCRITAVKACEYLTFVSYQTGIKTTSTYQLLANSSGTLVTETHHYRPSFKKIRPLSLMAWLMLGTGLLTRFAFKPEEDAFWFAKMEESVSLADEEAFEA